MSGSKADTDKRTNKQSKQDKHTDPRDLHAALRQSVHLIDPVEMRRNERGMETGVCLLGLFCTCR